MNEIIAYHSGKAVPISQNFVSTEFDCPCGCPDTLIDTLLVTTLQSLRTRVMKPVVITSAYRCHDYQEDLRSRGYETAKGVSTHQRGMAADIQVAGMSGEELERLARACGFTCVGVAAKWIHVDTRDGERRWTYGKR